MKLHPNKKDEVLEPMKEEKDHESFFKKIFGVLFKGITGVVTGIFNAITSTVGFLVAAIAGETTPVNKEIAAKTAIVFLRI